MMLTIVKAAPEYFPVVSPKLSNASDNDPNNIEKLSHDKNVLSFAKNTFGSIRAGTWIILVCPASVGSSVFDDPGILKSCTGNGGNCLATNPSSE
ncbi:hypothetical protein AYI68_g712 [Smittium mucronatum]|uniref:Uncharacterized protein n=1 Tax=Smittium mucronatum TaxID=133383 RepID=A0A1R0H7E9_9FUNG|nr:hypothetical protein AYI68_g712 [Smittium mucronatum]